MFLLPVLIPALTVEKAECQRTDAFELWCCRRLLKVPRIARRSNQISLKGDQPWIFTGRTEAETPVFWSSDADRRLTGKVPDAGKDCRQKGVSENEMAGWHHQCNEHELGQTPGDGEGQEGLACCSPRGHKQSDTTGRLDNNNMPHTTSVSLKTMPSEADEHSLPPLSPLPWSRKL